MATEQTFSTSDLRSHSVDYKRDNNSKSKWAHGGEIKTNGQGIARRSGHVAPIKAPNRFPLTNKDRGVHMAKMSQRHEINEERHSSDSSADEDVLDPLDAPHPDGDFTYSYDSKSGPSHGSQVLSLAVSKAVERYETKVTDNIVQKEWEVLDDAGEVMPKNVSKKHAKNNPSVDLEAEYEFV